MKFKVPIVIAAVVFATLNVGTLSAQKQNDEELLHVREAVWRAWFDGDTTPLQKLTPRETIVMSGGEEKWKKQPDVIRGAVDFHASGGKRTRLEFPRTEVQHFGNVAIVWSSYELETEVAGKRSAESVAVGLILLSVTLQDRTAEISVGIGFLAWLVMNAYHAFASDIQN